MKQVMVETLFLFELLYNSFLFLKTRWTQIVVDKQISFIHNITLLIYRIGTYTVNDEHSTVVAVRLSSVKS